MTDTVRTTEPAVDTLAPYRVMARGFAALRIFYGLDWLSNGLAKLFGQSNFDSGHVTFNLVDLGVANGILHQSVMSTPLGPLAAFYRDVVLPNWGFFGPFQTVVELAIGLGLLFGVATRLAAVGGLLLLVPIWIMLAGTNQYLWTYPLDLFPLLVLAIVPTGRVVGFDRVLAPRFRHRWPF